MGTFINLSNHPSSLWSVEQFCEAKKLGDVVDIPFPDISPTASTKDIKKMAKDMFIDINKFENPTVMVQGEFTFTYQLVRLLQKAQIRAVVCCSRRESKEIPGENGTTVKTSTYHFEGFRDYYI